MSTDQTQPLGLPDPAAAAAAENGTQTGNGNGTSDVTDAIPGAAADGTLRPAAGATAEVTYRETRVGTVVWGLVVVALGVLVLAVAAGAHIDGELAFIGLLAGAGMALLVGSLVVGIRRPRGRR